jgi:hypothetical protein
MPEKTPVLSCFTDESSDETRKEVFCVGAFLANEVHWKAIEGEWLKRLSQDGIAYFRAADCKSLRGPFRKLSRVYGSSSRAHDVADKIRADLEDILLSHHWLGFGVGIVMPEYLDVFHITASAQMLYSKDPTEAANSQIMYEVAMAVQRNAPECEVAYIIDDSSYSEKIANAFKAVKHNHPTLANTMNSVLPLDDRVTPPLQAADLIASVIKDGFLDWLRNNKSPHSPEFPEKWFQPPNHFESIGVWDETFMLHSIRTTLKSKQFINAGLAPRFVRKVTKTERKRVRKALIAKAMRRGKVD